MGLTIKNEKSDLATVELYGIIGDEYGGITAAQFRKELASIPSKTPINLHIHSDGGSFFDGVAMHSQLRQRTGPVNVIVDGLAASAASLVAMAGKTITMAKHSWMMIHEAHAVTWGRASDFRAAADRLDATNTEIVSIYAGRWKGNEKEMRAALDAETWLSAEDAVEMGLADSVMDSMAIAACVVDSPLKFKHAPQVLLQPLPGLIEAENVLSELFAEKK
jgi:ATP-dependent Clp protease protease subunit